MAFSHDIVIKEKMTQLANVTSQAQDRINAQILSSCARELSDNLEPETFDAYTLAFGALDEAAFNTFDGKSFNELTSDERWLRNLIFAEAYFGLYILALSLRKLVKGSVNLASESAGSAKITVANYDDIISNADYYREQALVCISASEQDEEESEVYSDGTLGIFVV